MENHPRGGCWGGEGGQVILPLGKSPPEYDNFDYFSVGMDVTVFVVVDVWVLFLAVTERQQGGGGGGGGGGGES